MHMADDGLWDIEPYARQLLELIAADMPASALAQVRERFMSELPGNAMPYETKRVMVALLDSLLDTVTHLMPPGNFPIRMELRLMRGSLARFDAADTKATEQKRLIDLDASLVLQLEEKAKAIKGWQAHVDQLRKQYVEKSRVPPYGDPELHEEHMAAIAVVHQLMGEGKELYKQRKEVEDAYGRLQS